MTRSLLTPHRLPEPEPLTAEQQAILDRFDRAPAAPESFVHLSTCRATADAPGLCQCPPAYVTVSGR